LTVTSAPSGGAECPNSTPFTEKTQKHLFSIDRLHGSPRKYFFEAALPSEQGDTKKMISTALSGVAASLSQVQGQIPATDTVSVQALQQAYQLIAQVQNTYQGQ
jgi:hypothetical protein